MRRASKHALAMSIHAFAIAVNFPFWWIGGQDLNLFLCGICVGLFIHHLTEALDA